MSDVVARQEDDVMSDQKVKEDFDMDKLNTFSGEALIHMDSLYRTAMRLTRNEKDAEDLVQETFLRGYKSFHQFQQGTNCRAWLFKIMTNLHINNYQKQARTPTSLSYEDIEEFYLYDQLVETTESIKVQNVEEEVLNGFMDSEVKEAIERLPYDFKITVILADIENFRYQEIAEILGCPIGTVRSRLSRGRKLLEKYLWDYAKKRAYFEEKCYLVDCKQAVDKLVDYLHHELDEANDKDIKKHMSQCKACCSRFEFEEKLSQAIKELGRNTAPESMRTGIVSKLKTLL